MVVRVVPLCFLSFSSDCIMDCSSGLLLLLPLQRCCLSVAHNFHHWPYSLAHHESVLSHFLCNDHDENCPRILSESVAQLTVSRLVGQWMNSLSIGCLVCACLCRHSTYTIMLISIDSLVISNTRKCFLFLLFSLTFPSLHTALFFALGFRRFAFLASCFLAATAAAPSSEATVSLLHCAKSLLTALMVMQSSGALL